MGSYLRRIECSKVSIKATLILLTVLRAAILHLVTAVISNRILIVFFFPHLAVPMPPIERLKMTDVFDANGKPKADVLKNHFLKEGRIEEDVALRIISSGTELLQQEPTMLEVEAPITGMCDW